MRALRLGLLLVATFLFAVSAGASLGDQAAPIFVGRQFPVPPMPQMFEAHAASSLQGDPAGSPPLALPPLVAPPLVAPALARPVPPPVVVP